MEDCKVGLFFDKMSFDPFCRVFSRQKTDIFAKITKFEDQSIMIDSNMYLLT